MVTSREAAPVPHCNEYLTQSCRNADAAEIEIRMFRLRRVAAVSLSALLALWAVVELFDPDRSPESWLLLKLFHPGPRYFEMAVDLEVDGKPVSILRTIECKPKFAHSNRAGGLGYSVGWYPTRYLVSQKLENGSGIMVVVPRACSLSNPPAPDFVPLIMWTQDADDPRILEAYLDKDRLLRGGLRIRLTRFNLVQNAKQQTEQPPGDFADLLNVFTKNPSPSGPRIQFTALAGLKLPAPPVEVPPTAQNNQGLHVLPNPVISPGKPTSELIGSAIGQLSGEYHPDLPPDLAERRRRLDAGLAELYAFRPTAEQQFEFTDAPTGVVYFVRSDLKWCGQAGRRCIAADGEATTISDSRIKHYLVHDGEVFVAFEIYLTLIRRH